MIRYTLKKKNYPQNALLNTNSLTTSNARRKGTLPPKRGLCRLYPKQQNSPLKLLHSKNVKILSLDFISPTYPCPSPQQIEVVAKKLLGKTLGKETVVQSNLKKITKIELDHRLHRNTMSNYISLI